MGFFREHFTRKSVDVQRKGLGRWFEIIEEHYFDLFAANGMMLLWMLPAVVCFATAIYMSDIRLWLLGMVCYMLTGSAITAMHAVCAKIVLRKHVWGAADFLSCMKREWKRSVIVSGVLSVVYSVCIMALYLVYKVEGGIPILVLVIFTVYLFLLIGFTIFVYQQLAIVDLPLGAVIRNAFLLIAAGQWHSAAAILLTMLILVLFYLHILVGSTLLILGAAALLVTGIDLLCEDELRQCLLEEKV